MKRGNDYERGMGEKPGKEVSKKKSLDKGMGESFGKEVGGAKRLSKLQPPSPAKRSVKRPMMKKEVKFIPKSRIERRIGPRVVKVEKKPAVTDTEKVLSKSRQEALKRGYGINK